MAINRFSETCFFFLFFFTLVTGPRRSLSLKLNDTRVYEPQMRTRLGTIAHDMQVETVEAAVVGPVSRAVSRKKEKGEAFGAGRTSERLSEDDSER